MILKADQFVTCVGEGVNAPDHYHNQQPTTNNLGVIALEEEIPIF